ncbi:maltose alpha-D-glucosyltransferase [Chitinophagaceae bacterium LB-8]|uniref:maltose alpha-D-glucosyltransferase n=1 Tax=Paraflavisolibacter caeni TaxID=2982496 RepID=A0A9X2Y111_9BACT|nr:maltose alpha-D-glucosyltransferase [Paraflavisolibacter caeni]MCU7551193.1 maltose alpha-D-glucosyltransferase [Paraflavisolibacter caeni]
MAENTTVLDDKLHWYKDAVIYELHIKAFCDGNGDGIGDFTGLLQKLDYLQELGITAVWVLPFYPSPLRDDGYDIADYYSINPSYGNIADFKKFLSEAHNRNLKVITELVINHTSDQHPWFQRARTAPKYSPERDYYVWTDNPNQYKDVRIIFQDFETSNWTWDPVAQQYYWHRFFHHQPDLNYDNPMVQEEVFKIIDYWCAMGVDGFRLDAVPYLFEREGTNGENLPETHAFLKKLRAHMDQHFPGTAFLAEANMWPEDSASYFGDGDECHMNYHFPVMPRMFMALQREDRYPITDIFDQTPAIPETCQWAMFLRNHDELTLEMVTDEERDYMYKVYAKDPKARINLGIRHRLAPLMENSRRKIELMNSLLFSLPGTPVIYYGDEIGMGDNFYLGDRNGVRTPMQWSPDRNAGFSATNPQKLYLPVILDPAYHYESVNVETQRQNTSSLFWFMKRIINMRKKYKALSRGDMKFINVENPKVLAFTRTYGKETLLIISNLSKYSQPAELDIKEFKGYIPVEVISKNKFPIIKEESPYFFTLGPHSFLWFELEKVYSDAEHEEALVSLKIDQWEDLLKNSMVAELEENILPDYLRKVKWFKGIPANIRSTRIAYSAAVPLGQHNAFILLVEVSFESGLPEAYQIPVTFVKEPASKSIAESYPLAILSQIKVGEEEGLLCDALYTTEFQQVLFTRMAEAQNIKFERSEIKFYGREAMKKLIEDAPEVPSKIHNSEITHTAITYGNCFILQMYRKIDRGLNPDAEITRYLTEVAKFKHIPPFVGAIEWSAYRDPSRDFVVLGMMQELIENHGDGYSFMLERINNYIERILARDRSTLAFQKKGSLTDPISFDQIPEDRKEFIGGTAADQARWIGERTGELHLALTSHTGLKEFAPEEFSLHYQRSLFASMQSLVRETYQSLSRNLKRLPEHIKGEAEEIFARRDDVLNKLKRIYARKLDVVKIRIHDNYHLRKILLSGRDLSINDFGGNPTRAYSERRLKRSPLRDVASMYFSFHYVAYEGFLKNTHIQKDDVQQILPFAGLWAHYMGGFFVKAYLQTVQDSTFIPKEKEDLEMLLQTYLLEKSLLELNYNINNNPDKIIAPIRIIKSILG